MTVPSIRVNGGSAGVKAAVSASSAFTAALDSTSGVRSCTWSVLSTDETSSTASYTLVTSGSVGQNVASTSLGLGTAMLLKAVINGGINLSTGLADADNTVATVKIYVPLANGSEVGAAGEEYESDATFGSTGLLNAAIRAADALSPSGIAVKLVKAATVAALPANTRTSNVLTASANGAFATVDGVTINAGDRFLAQTEGGGASHVNNGVYTLTTAGSGGTPWTATRATDFDATSELIQGTTFICQQGTTYAGKSRYLATSGATINVTALEFASAGDVTTVTATRPIVSSGGSAPDISWLPNANVSLAGYSLTTCTGVTNAGGAVAITAGGGAASLAGSTTATVSANGGALLLEGATTATLNATTGALAMTGATTAAITATAGALTCTGGTTAALTASSGAASITGSTEVNVSPLLNVRRDDASTNTILDVATLRRTTAGTAANGIGGRLAFELEDSAGNADVAGTMAVDYLDATSTSEDARILFRAQVAGTLTDSLSLRGTTIRAHGLAGSGSGFVAVDNNGDFSWNAGAGASATEYYLVNAGSTALANGVPIQAVAATVQFNSASVMPLSARRVDAVDDSTALDVFSVLRAGPGTAANGIGANVRIVLDNADGDAVDAALLTTTFTDVTAASEDAKFAISLASGGAMTERLTLDSLGALAVDSTVTATGFVGTSLDTATATSATIGATNMTALTVTPDTTFSGTVTKTGTALTTTVVPGFVATNTTAATAGVTVQNGYAYVSSGSGWETGGGGSAKTVRAGFAVQPVSSGSIGLNYRLVTDVGTGTLAFVNTYYTTSVPGFGGSAWTSQTFVAWSDIGNGYRLITTGGTEYGALKVSSDSTVLEAKRNTSTGRGEVWSNITTGSTDDGVRIWNYAGTRSAGNLLAVGDGAAWAQKWAVGYDGRTVTPRVISAADAPASAAAAVTFDLSRSAHIEHTTTEDTTVTLSNLTAGQSGTIVFIQGATGRTITMPAASGTIKYSEALVALGVTAMVNTTATYITIMHYRITAGGVILIHAREVLPA